VRPEARARGQAAPHRDPNGATRGFIVDFYCAAQRLVLELEGDAHDGPDQRAYDAARAEVLEAAGFRVVRVRNGDVTRAGLEAIVRNGL